MPGLSTSPPWSLLLTFYPTLFVHLSPHGQILLLLYVKDKIVPRDDFKYTAFVKARLREQFLRFDLGPLNCFLGIKISSTCNGFCISQQKCIQNVALTDDCTIETLMCLVYRHLVGSIVYLAATRPDISYPVQSESVCLYSHSGSLHSPPFDSKISS